MKIVLEESKLKVVLSDPELNSLLQGKILEGKCQLSDEDNVLRWSVEARYISGVPDLFFDNAYLRIKLPQIELSNLLEDEIDCIAHVLHPSKHELHLCIEKKAEQLDLASEGHPSALRKTS